MAELVSIRSANDKSENMEDKITTQTAITNPAYAHGDIGLEQSIEGANGEAYNTKNKAFELQGTTISFRDIKYTVDVKIKRKKAKKEIVKGIRWDANVNKACSNKIVQQ